MDMIKSCPYAWHKLSTYLIVSDQTSVVSTQCGTVNEISERFIQKYTKLN